jgi:hypothetical protein
LPLEVSPTTGCLAIEPGTALNDILLFDTSTSSWNVSALPPPAVDVQSSPALPNFNSTTFTFNTTGALFNPTWDAFWAFNYGNTGALSTSGSYYWKKVGTAATGPCYVDIMFRLASWGGTPGLVSSSWVQNLPFRSTPFSSSDECSGVAMLQTWTGTTDGSEWVGHVEAQLPVVTPPVGQSYILGSAGGTARIYWGLQSGTGASLPSFTGIFLIRYVADVDGPAPPVL